MIVYFKNQNSSVFYKSLNQSEVLQVTKEKQCIGISVLSTLFKEIFAGNIVEIDKDEFIAAYSEVKRELINHNVLQEEEKEIYLSEVFQQWADLWFSGLSGVDIIKKAAMESMQSFSPKILGLFTSNMFKKQLRSWCSHNGFEFQDRIHKLVNGKTTEHIRITSKY